MQRRGFLGTLLGAVASPLAVAQDKSRSLMIGGRLPMDAQVFVSRAGTYLNNGGIVSDDVLFNDVLPSDRIIRNLGALKTGDLLLLRIRRFCMRPYESIVVVGSERITAVWAVAVEDRNIAIDDDAVWTDVR